PRAGLYARAVARGERADALADAVPPGGEALLALLDMSLHLLPPHRRMGRAADGGAGRQRGAARDQHRGDRDGDGLQRDPPRRSRRRETGRSEEHTSELQSPYDLVCRLLLEKKKKKTK